MNELLHVLIVDDEYHARKLLSEYVSKLPFLTLTGMASNVFEAMTILQKEKIDILLLDIQMPEITGLEFARRLKNPPAIIFTTAYSEYAVESYELDVVDYLLKPIAFPRFLQAINKVTERKGIPETSPTPVVNVIQQPPATPEEDCLIIKSGYKVYRINYEELIYIEGQREYVTFHTTKQRITTLFSLKELEERLPSDQFIRIHKSYIISLKHIDMIERNILQIAGKKLPVGGSYKDSLMSLFK
ncbi:DNA-binding LytR/AlgR family response regulator [Parabacteroides sp. PF5-5]|uniref:LytR/AlgR family response regulator transcription factor n=1 Tax=unclassified Parabacteroides TaxID=2649774 RepID=UPI00247697DE|nr:MULTISPECIES: LytTR family DNA-binding domain-containing protein [unclassified Parabacteroides]MDH6304743.1 DNA-binding LytR/AlgR family response regulator [Parabacteroides sp. PH5-39]MDH6315642.1 DNA-binding LytR/AlgR family response regulator [Parabacteroides sp. PF5-13]MDH6319303.1 DNA-binding LytR/AlgR family response regulator [Parabacteroides sp. PH5-13]MDH6323034.1 DNA-binding LytR/AlgR family response regulator [Parabacteroides sp. PH5-8]MDH6326835.1 DNA-binding LytR/AlgR family res